MLKQQYEKINIPCDFLEHGPNPQHTTNNDYEFCTGNGVFIMMGLFILTAICVFNVVITVDGVKYYWLVSVMSGLLFGVVMFFILLLTYKSGEWIQLVTAMCCDVPVIVILCTVICISIYTSMALRGIIFKILTQIRFNKNAGNSLSAWNYSAPYTDDVSLQKGYALLTEYTQNEIIKNQYPSSCSGKTMLVSELTHVGFGAETHVYALMLGKAMDSGYVFSWGENACTLWGGHCRDFFLPEHNCTADDVASMHTETYTSLTDMTGTQIPSQFKLKFMEAGLDMTDAQQIYWWKAQGSAFLMRFNDNTIANVNAMRQDTAVNPRLAGRIPVGTVNVNIRTGDKFDEINLPEAEDYIEAVDALFQNAPMSFSRWIFITSDNLNTIQRVEEIANMKGWGVLFSNTPRMQAGYVQGDVRSFWNYNVTISILMQLTMAMDCSAWVGTRGSNWNRLIDERRCVSYPKCALPFKEMVAGVDGMYDSPSAIV